MDRPYWVQYLEWLRGIVSGELGKSYRYELPTWQLIRPLLPVTLELAGPVHRDLGAPRAFRPA